MAALFKPKIVAFTLAGLLSVVLVGGTVVSGYLKLQAEAQNSGKADDLSARAQEFIAQDSRHGTGVWSAVNLVTPASPATTSAQPAGTQVTTPCFTVTIPFKVVRPTQSQVGAWCTFQARSLAPAGELVIASYPAADFVADPGVQLRQRQPQVYTATALNLNQFTRVVTYQSADSSTLFAWKSPIMITIALSNLSQPGQATPALLEKVATTVEVSPASASAQPSQLLP